MRELLYFDMADKMLSDDPVGAIRLWSIRQLPENQDGPLLLDESQWAAVVAHFCDDKRVPVFHSMFFVNGVCLVRESAYPMWMLQEALAKGGFG